MDVIVIKKNNKEVGRVVPSKRTLLIGRSPICDLVLRSNEMRPLHFLLEWIGEGDFKPTEGFWSLVDISKSNDSQAKGFSGEAAILQKSPINFEGYEFLIAKDDLAETAVGKGVLSRSMDFDADQKAGSMSVEGKTLVIELITYDRRNDVVTNVNHFNREQLLKGLRVLTLPKLSFSLTADKNSTLTVENLGEVNLLDVYNRTERLTNDFKTYGKKVEITPADFFSFITADTAYYFRWVPRVEFVPPPVVWTKDPAILTLLGVFFFIGVTFVLMSQVKLPEPEEIPEPKRVARVEIQSLVFEPPPPPPAPPAQQTPTENPPVTPPPAEEVQTSEEKQLTLNDQKKAENDTPKAASEKTASNNAPKGDPKQATVKNTDKNNTRSGLDLPAPVKNVNQVGILGKLKGGTKSNERLSADAVVNKGRPTDSAVGDTGSVALNQAPLGRIGSSRNHGSSSDDEGPGLAGASTTLRSNKAAEGPSVGGLAGPRGKGKLGGEGLIGKPEGGSGGFGLDAKSMDVTGGLTKEDIRTSLRENQRAIRNCYERALLSKNRLEGRLGLRWKISPTGSVETIAIQNTTVGMPSLENCVLEVVRKIQFPQAPNRMPTTVIYPFVFTPKKNEAK